MKKLSVCTRRAPNAVKEYAKKHPHSMGEWSQASRTHVATMKHGDFYHGEKSMTLDKARNAAELIGCGVAYPQGIEGSDFCDLLKEYGTGGAKHIERLVLSRTKYVLGSSA